MRRLISMACLCSIVMVLGCGGDGGGGPTDTAQSLTASGWALFEQGEYEQAIGKFERALGLDADYADAFNGLGWSHAKLDSLANSLENFGMCVSTAPSLTEGYAGCAPVYRDYDAEPAHFDSAVAFAGTALTQDSDFEFSHDENFDWRDLRLIMAQSYYGLGEFLLAKGQVDALGGVSLDTESDTFVEDLAAEIERLEGLYGG
ncbi:MAG: tetratricopeptide repeat protein [bacterium]